MATLSQVLTAIRQRESSGNYSLSPQQNFAYPASHASGAYQFQPATWQQYTAASGIGTQYAEAYQAPPAVQDAVAAYAATNGPGINSSALWGASAPAGGYPAIDSIDMTPAQLAASGLPAGPADTSSGLPAGPGGVPLTEVVPSFLPGASPLLTTPAGAKAISVGLVPGLGEWIASTFGTLFGGIANWFVRGFLIVLGIVLVAIALWHLMGKPELPAGAVAAAAA